MNEGPAIALQALHDEALSAEEPRTDFFWNPIPIVTPRAEQRKESFCASNSPPSAARSTAMIFPG